MQKSAYTDLYRCIHLNIRGITNGIRQNRGRPTIDEMFISCFKSECYTHTHTQNTQSH